jgi:hypothetical protein
LQLQGIKITFQLISQVKEVRENAKVEETAIILRMKIDDMFSSFLLGYLGGFWSKSFV